MPTTPNFGLDQLSLNTDDVPDLKANFDLLDLLAARKGVIGEGIQYVTPAGSDAKDGLSIGTAKLTIGAAYDALPAGGGTIYYVGGVAAQADGKGLWLRGTDDTGPGGTGWRAAKPIALVAIGGFTNWIDNAHFPTAEITFATGPGLWLAGGLEPMLFDAMRLQGLAGSEAMRLGRNSDNTQDVGIQCKVFNRCNWRAAQVAGVTTGPTMLMAGRPDGAGYGNSHFWNYAIDCVITANESATDLSDQRQSVVARGEGGLLYLIRPIFNGGGGCKVHVGASGCAVKIEDLTQEGTTTPGSVSQPMLWTLAGSSFAPTVGWAEGSNLGAADKIGTHPNVRNDFVDAGVLRVSGINGRPVAGQMVEPIQGAATLLGNEPAMYVGAVGTPARWGQVGFWRNRVAGQVDAGRRMFAPVAAQWPNLAPQDVSGWGAAIGGATVTTGVADPAGGTRAATLSVGAGAETRQIYRAVRGLGVGDFLLAGVWSKAGTPANGPITGLPPLRLSLNAGGGGYAFVGGATFIDVFQPIFGDGEWEWIWGLVEVGAVGGGACEVIYSLLVDSSHPMGFFAPLLCHIPAGQRTRNEIAELAQSAPAWSDRLSQGVVGVMAGQDLEVPDNARGVVLRSPNGNRFRLTVSNAGVVAATAL